jgi:hypothetical protein
MDINGLFAAYRQKPMSVADYDNVAAEQQANQLNALMMRQKYQQSQADMAEADAFKQALRGGADSNGLMAASPTRAMAHQGALLKQQETQADIGYKQAQAGKIAFEQKQVLRGHALAGAEHVKTPADMGGLLGILEQSGDISKEQVAQIMQGVQQRPETIPQIVAQFRQTGMTVMQQEEAKHKAAQLGETARGHDLTYKASTENNAATNARVAAEGAANRGVSIRGQNMTDARARADGGGVLGKPPSGYRWKADGSGEQEPIPGGPASVDRSRPLPAGVLKQITETRDNAATMARMENSFKPEYAGKGFYGIGADLAMDIKGRTGTDQKSVDWWKNYRKDVELTERHALFGAALTPTEQASWRSADISAGMDADVIKTNLKTRANLSKKIHEFAQQDLKDAGHNAQRIDAIAGRTAPDASATKTIQSDADYNALPSGATFVGPDGKTRRKP